MQIDPRRLAMLLAVHRAGGVLAAAEGERGVFRHEGRMIDEPILRHARSLVARAENA